MGHYNIKSLDDELLKAERRQEAVLFRASFNYPPQSIEFGVEGANRASLAS